MIAIAKYIIHVGFWVSALMMLVGLISFGLLMYMDGPWSSRMEASAGVTLLGVFFSTFFGKLIDIYGD